MKFNMDECSVLPINVLSFSHPSTVREGNPLMQVNSVKYLGVTPNMVRTHHPSKQQIVMY